MRSYGVASCSSALIAEHDKNVMRKAFTICERVAIAIAIAEELAGRHGKNQHSGGGSISTSSAEGKTRDIAAAKAGLGSGKTYEAAKRVVENGVMPPGSSLPVRSPGRPMTSRLCPS